MKMEHVSIRHYVALEALSSRISIFLMKFFFFTKKYFFRKKMKIILMYFFPFLGAAMVPTPDKMEDLLHLAMRYSNLTRLRELAENGHKMNVSESAIGELMAAFQKTQDVFKETVNRSLIIQDLESEQAYLESFDFIEDHGDHLLDKGDLLHKMNALEPLLDCVLKVQVNETITTRVIERAADLLVSIAQNRESTQILILSLRPFILPHLVENIQTSWQCFVSFDNDNLCSSLIGVLNALLYERFDQNQSWIRELAKILSHFDKESKSFSKLLTTFRILKMNNPYHAEWVSSINIGALSETARSADGKIADRILNFLESIGHRAEEKRINEDCESEDQEGNGLCPSFVSKHSSEL